MNDPTDSTVFAATGGAYGSPQVVSPAEDTPSSDAAGPVVAPDSDSRTRDGSGLVRRPRAVSEATRIGRYILLGTLGAGGMGVVVAAYDPKLDRKVAIKLLHGLQSDDTPRRLRLEREAQAMARLSHPNVVTIYEVGEHAGQLFMAMEFVKGRDLRRWLTERGPSVRWRDVLDIFMQAGEGLAAAHAVGIIHRDFKPGNVFVGDDGRVRVGDFGLARQEADSETAATRARFATGAPVLGWQVTATGAVMGTPGYMAPEQFRGEATDARTDQFAFCVALWEALYGRRPFVGESFTDMLVAVTEGRRSPPPPGSSVPAWLRRVLERGLSQEPCARHPTTAALLAALRADPTRRRRVLAGAAAFALAVAGGIGAQRYLEARQIAACEADSASIAEVWNDDVRQRLRDGLLATRVAYAATTADNMIPYITAQAEAWREGRASACLNTRVHGTWDEDMLDRARWCLDERRIELAALVAEFSQANASSALSAVFAATNLAQVKPCLDVGRIARMPPPPGDREGASAVQALLFQAAAKHAAGKYGEALLLTDDALARAEALAIPSLAAAARFHRGNALLESGKYNDAEVALKDAYFQAAEAGAWEVAAPAARTLVFTLGEHQERIDDALLWGRHGEVALAQLGADTHSLSRAHLLNDMGVVRDHMFEYATAREMYERALAIKQHVLGPDHPDVATSLQNLGLLHHGMGDYEEARPMLERALAIRETTLGPDHPFATGTLSSLGILHSEAGRYEEARTMNERALAIREETLGPDHPAVADSLDALALVHRYMGGYEEARTMYERALALHEKTLGPDHHSVARSLYGLARVHTAMHEYEAAFRLHERALAIREKALGPEHPYVAGSLMGLASVHHAAGRLDEARALYERALAILEKALGPEHRYLTEPLTGLASTHAAAGRHVEAKALAERALAIWDRLVPEHPQAADALMVLAEIALAQDRTVDAAGLAERAVYIRETRAVAPEKLEQARTLLARAR